MYLILSISAESPTTQALTQSTTDDIEMPLEVSRLLESQSLHGSMLKQLEDGKIQAMKECQVLKENTEKTEQQLRVLLQEKDALFGELNALKGKNEDICEKQDGTEQASNKQLEELREQLTDRHKQEMEQLRTYFEEKCSQIGKQYSDEIISQQSKKMCDDSDDLTDDIYFVGDIESVSLRMDDEKSKFEDQEDKASAIAMYEEQIQALKQELEELKKKCGRSSLLNEVYSRLSIYDVKVTFLVVFPFVIP